MIVYGLKYGHDGIRGTAACRQDSVTLLDIAGIDAGNDVFNLTLARCGENYFACAFRLEMFRQAVHIAPGTCVINDQGVMDAIRLVVHLIGAWCVNHANHVTVRDNALVLFIHPNGALKTAVDGIPTQQACALDQVILSGFTHHDGTQTQLTATACFFDQQACQQASDTPKPVKHHILWRRDRSCGGTDDTLAFLGGKFFRS